MTKLLQQQLIFKLIVNTELCRIKLQTITKTETKRVTKNKFIGILRKLKML